MPMASESQFPEFPPIRLQLTEEQAAKIEAAKPPGNVPLVFGYAQRHHWPNPDRFSLVAWFVEMREAEQALIAAGIMLSERSLKRKATPRKKRAKSKA